MSAPARLRYAATHYATPYDIVFLVLPPVLAIIWAFMSTYGPQYVYTMYLFHQPAPTCLSQPLTAQSLSRPGWFAGRS